MNESLPNNPDPSELERLVSLAAGELDNAQAAELRSRVNSEPSLASAYAKIEKTVQFLRAETGTLPSAEALARAKRALAQSRPSGLERVVEGIRRVIAGLDLDTRLTPAVAGIRGAGATAQLAYSTEDADIDLELVAVSDALWRLKGQIDADEEGGWQITISDRAAKIAAAETESESGAFEADLPAGSYLIELRRGDLQIEVGPVLIP